MKRIQNLKNGNKFIFENTEINKIEKENFKIFSSQKKISSSEIEIDANVKNILNSYFPRIPFGAELFKENR